MDYKKVIEKHVELQTVVDYTTCDVCKKKICDDAGWRSVNCEISMIATSIYGDYDSQEFDICQNCFENQLIPWFEQFGSFPRDISR